MKRWGPLLVCWLAVAGLSYHLMGQRSQWQPARPALRYQDLLLDLLGEGRTLLARWLWFKVDLIHEDEDVKGVDVFQQKELIPLLRMITYLDPYFTDAYDLIAYDLHKGYGKTEMAVDLVEEGLKYSPDSYALNFRRAFLALYQKDPDNLLKYAKLAFYAANNDPEANKILPLRLMYRAAVMRNDARLGVVVVEHMLAAGGRVPDIEQMKRWREELKNQP